MIHVRVKLKQDRGDIFETQCTFSNHIHVVCMLYSLHYHTRD